MIIKDKSLGKYEIHHDGCSYTVCEKTNRVDKQGNDIFKSHAFCSSVENALRKVARLLIEKSDAQYTVSEYITELKNISEKIIKID